MNINVNEYKFTIDKSGPYGITLGPDGAMWFTENRGNKVGQITTKGWNYMFTCSLRKLKGVNIYDWT